MAKLSPAANEIYRAVYPTGSGAQAADELRKASKDKWRQLVLSRLIVRHESEWANPAKWDSLFAQVEERTAHDPTLDEEKKRITKLVWWSDVTAGQVQGFPSSPDVFHIHPIGLLGNFVGKTGYFCQECRVDLTVTSDVLREIFPAISVDNANGFAPELNAAFEKYEINTCHRVAHFFGQCAVECGGFTAFAESLYYKDGNRLWSTYHSALVRGLRRLYPAWSEAQMEKYTKTDLIKNDQGLGLVLFGDSQYPDVDYRGRGLLHLTWMENYLKYKAYSGVDIVKDPLSVQSDKHVATDSSAWYWYQWGINAVADENKVVRVTAKINPALKDIGRRKDAAKTAFRVINKESQLCKQKWEATLDQVYGW